MARFSGWFAPAMAGQPAGVAVFDEDRDVLVGYEAAPATEHGNDGSVLQWDVQLRRLGFRRVSDWRRSRGRTWRCEVERDEQQA